MLFIYTTTVMSEKEKRMSKQLGGYILLVLFFEISWVLIVDPVRSLFDGPTIGTDKAVGYSQFFQYPIFFDSIFFIVIVLIPVLVAYIFGKYAFNNKK